jgi:short-subunit dehydrogenase
MIARGSGTILFTGGGFGVHPHPDFVSLSIGKAGIRALTHAIFDPFQQKGVHVATVTVAGLVTNRKDANAVAEQFWQLHSQPAGSWLVETVYTPAG